MLVDQDSGASTLMMKYTTQISNLGYSGPEIPVSLTFSLPINDSDRGHSGTQFLVDSIYAYVL